MGVATMGLKVLDSFFGGIGLFVFLQGPLRKRLKYDVEFIMFQNVGVKTTIIIIYEKVKYVNDP